VTHSIEMKQQKHMSTDVLYRLLKIIVLFQNYLPHCKIFVQLDKRHHMFY